VLQDLSEPCKKSLPSAPFCASRHQPDWLTSSVMRVQDPKEEPRFAALMEEAATANIETGKYYGAMKYLRQLPSSLTVRIKYAKCLVAFKNQEEQAAIVLEQVRGQGLGCTLFRLGQDVAHQTSPLD
jgi:hypothetical protein